MTMTPTIAAASARARRSPHPIVYMILYLPTGIGLGYLTTAFAWLLSQAGASVAQVAGLAAMSVLPNTWRIAWAPLVDTALSAKTWFRLSVVVQASVLAGLALLPLKTDLLPVFAALCLLSGAIGTVSNMAVERFMALSTPPDVKGRAAGWSQAGLLGASGLAGGGGLWLTQHASRPWIAGMVLSAVCLGALLPALWLEDPEPILRGRSYRAALAETWRDVLSLVRARPGLLAGLLLVLPIGSGGLSFLWAPIAKDWGAGAGEVALLGGLLAVLVNMPAAIAGGWLADRIDKKLNYAIFGVALAAVALAMVVAPRTPAVFMTAAVLYTAITGFCCGAFVAVILEAVGGGAVATKFNLLISLCNIPILTVTLVDGWAETRFGPTGMLLIEAALGLGGVALYAAVAFATRGLSWADARGWVGLGPGRSGVEP